MNLAELIVIGVCALALSSCLQLGMYETGRTFNQVRCDLVQVC